MASNNGAPFASILIPTRARLRYLEVALASIAPQAARAGVEMIVIDDDGPSEQARSLAARYGARYEAHERTLGLNAARNTGMARSDGELIVFVDDDVEVREGWLSALLAAAREHPDVDVFTGPIHARLEGSPPRGCGRERPPITSLDLGERDAPAPHAWGANMTIRRAALERVGPFDTSLSLGGGDEQEWQERLLAGGGSIMYVAGAALDHRRDADDARLGALCRAAFERGRSARRFDAWRGEAPHALGELRTLAACLGHVVRRRCPLGLTMAAHSLGRAREAIVDVHPIHIHTRARVKRAFLRARAREEQQHKDRQHQDTHPPVQGKGTTPTGAIDDFLSGESGTVGGLDGLRRAALDRGADLLAFASGRSARLDRAAQWEPQRRNVLVLCIERPEHRESSQAIRTELERSRHHVESRFGAAGEGGKFENLNVLLGAGGGDRRDLPLLRGRDWLIVIDDDISLPRNFLDRFLLLAERFALDLAQPAHQLSSHAAWRVTRRRPGSLARETHFVEIGPVTAFARRTFPTLLPFPELRMGWGLDVHWAALARERGWRCGIIDATPIRHRIAPAADSYPRDQAIAEARAFLAGRPYLPADEAQQTLVTHRRL